MYVVVITRLEHNGSLRHIVYGPYDTFSQAMSELRRINSYPEFEYTSMKVKKLVQSVTN